MNNKWSWSYFANILPPEHTAIHAYEAKQEGDLSFEAGDTVIVFEMLANGWWRGCSSGQEGWFPATYVEVRVLTFMLFTSTFRLARNTSPVVNDE